MLVELSVLITRVFCVVRVPDILGLRPRSLVPIVVLAGG
jgi:hypothetical protein